VVLPEPSLALGFTWLLLSIDLLSAVLGDPGGQAGAESLEGAPQPPGALVELALYRQPREQVGPVAPDLGQPGGLRAAAEQVAHQRHGEHLNVTAGRNRPVSLPRRLPSSQDEPT
jgi:hypothetical protein